MKKFKIVEEIIPAKDSNHLDLYRINLLNIPKDLYTNEQGFIGTFNGIKIFRGDYSDSLLTVDDKITCNYLFLTIDDKCCLNFFDKENYERFFKALNELVEKSCYLTNYTRISNMSRNGIQLTYEYPVLKFSIEKDVDLEYWNWRVLRDLHKVYKDVDEDGFGYFFMFIPTESSEEEIEKARKKLLKFMIKYSKDAIKFQQKMITRLEQKIIEP